MEFQNIFRRQRFQQSAEKDLQPATITTDNHAFSSYAKLLDADECCILLEDNQYFQLHTSALFVPSPVSVSYIRGEELPQWANIDPKTGVISGTVAHDASVFGRSEICAIANDEHQNELVLKLILCPQNLAPIADRTIHDCEVAERSPFDMNLESLFYDPFAADDPNIVCVSGLPKGLSFDPETNSISGKTLDQTASRAPYVVTVLARSEQNRLTRQHFLLKVTSPHRELPDTGKASEKLYDCNDRRSEIRATRLAKLRNMFVSKKPAEKPLVKGAESVWKNGEIKGEWSIEMPDDPNLNSVDTVIPEASKTDLAGTGIALKQKKIRDGLSKDDRLDRISIDAIRRQNKLYLEFQNNLDARRDGRVQCTSILGECGKPLPGWMKVVREGFVVANLPPDIHSVDIELNVEFGTGLQLVKPLRVNF